MSAARWYPAWPIQGQVQGYETLKVRKLAIFRMYLLSFSVRAGKWLADFQTFNVKLEDKI